MNRMKYCQLKVYARALQRGAAAFCICAMLFLSCQKIEYTEMDNPAYLRVFNGLNLPDILETGVVDSLPYLCMLINPEYDDTGMPIGAEIVGDFLDRRARYAPPFPQHIGASTSVDNPEYPGKEPVLVGPVLNGFDLSSWAQVPAGDMEVLFMYRPKNAVPFFDLSKEQRSDICAKGSFTLEVGEVYTMQVLFADFETRSREIALREEVFHKMALSDSLVYVNFYNYSAAGYNDAEATLKIPKGKVKRHLFEGGVRDTMDIYMSLMQGQDFVFYSQGVVIRDAEFASSTYSHKFLYSLQRDLRAREVAPYFSFPLRISQDDGSVYTDLWQRFYLIAPGMGILPTQNPYSEYGIYSIADNYTGGPYVDPKGNFATINCVLNGPILFTGQAQDYHTGVNTPNLIINTHSGRDNPRSFASVNTFEVINGEVYLMALQRKYAPPIY